MSDKPCDKPLIYRLHQRRMIYIHTYMRYIVFHIPHCLCFMFIMFMMTLITPHPPHPHRVRVRIGTLNRVVGTASIIYRSAQQLHDFNWPVQLGVILSNTAAILLIFQSY